MAEVTQTKIIRPAWHDISQTDYFIFNGVLLGMLFLGVLYALEWQSAVDGFMVVFPWIGFMVSWWAYAILAGQWHGWRARLGQFWLASYVVLFLGLAVYAVYLKSSALKDVPEQALIKLLWQRAHYDILALKIAKPAILTGFCILGVLGALPPLFWRRRKLPSVLPENLSFSWRTRREGAAIGARYVTSRLWVVKAGNKPFIEISCYFDDKGGIVAAQYARWFATLPLFGAIIWSWGSPTLVHLAVALAGYVVVRPYELNFIDKEWPWPRRTIGAVRELEAITMEPLANYYVHGPKATPKRGHALVMHFADGRQEKISVTDQSASDLIEVHTMLTRALIDNKAALLATPKSEAKTTEKVEIRI